MAKKDGRRHNKGRPPLGEKLKKKALPLKVKPELLAAINEQTKGKNRNHEVEMALEARFLRTEPITAA